MAVNFQSYKSQIKQALQFFLQSKGFFKTGNLVGSIQVDFNLNDNFPVSIQIKSEDYLVYLGALQTFYNTQQFKIILESLFKAVIEHRIEELIESNLNEEQ